MASYTKKTWVDDEVIEASDLNNMENGIYNITPVSSVVTDNIITLVNGSGNAIIGITLPLYTGGVE